MKAILVIDMPNNCEECKITYFQGHDEESSTCYSGDLSKRPSWCPLRPLPQKKEITESMVLNQHYQDLVNYHSGWNACIDEILGEEE